MEKPASSEDNLRGLTDNRAELLTLMIEKKLRSAREVKPRARIDAASDVYMPVSAAQHRLWFFDQLERGSAAYNITMAIRVLGALDLIAFKGALESLVKRHETLRTVFAEVHGEPMQRIAKDGRFPLHVLDVQAVQDRDAEVLKHLKESSALPFDLKSGPLIRGRLLQLSHHEHMFVVTMHHIVADGWSMDVLIRELAALYTARRQQQPDRLPKLAIQYADHAQWQREWLSGAHLREQLRFWETHLQGASELLELPTDRPRPATRSYRGDSASVSLGAELTADLRSFARRMNVTLATALHTAWSILLCRLSGEDDIVIGMPVANRNRTDLEGLIGLFVNTLAVRVRLQDDPPVIELLRRAKENLFEAYAHQDVPFEKVVEALQPDRSLSHNPIFQVMFVMQGPRRPAIEAAGLTLLEQPVPLQLAHFDLSLYIQEASDRILVTLNYATDLFEADTIRRWADCFEVLLREMLARPDERISKLPLLGVAERRQIIEQFNATHTNRTHTELLHELFEAQAARVPDAIALVYEGRALTYRELNSKANQLARYLRARGVGPDRLVALFVERSPEMVVGLLGILKAGGAYVPLDPVHPRERLLHMIEDSRPEVVVTQARLRERADTLHPAAPIVLDVDAWEEHAWAELSTRNLQRDESGHAPSNLAYVIYTSGSTGKPKGVMIEHRNVLHFIHGMQERIHGVEPDCRRIAWNSSFGFDMAVKAWGQLTLGRTVYLLSEATRLSSEKLMSFLEEHRIDAIECTPSYLRMMQEAGLLNGRASCLRKVLLGGEAIDAATWNELATAEDTAFFNMYGPTECSVDASCGRISGGTPHVGSVMPDAHIYILDRWRQPVPLGVAGEIYIGGAGVGRGYLNRPDLTAERFVTDPFSGTRMYKTGDVGCWRSDATIEYLGRNDHQVKIRGFRIELGEIEAQLIRHEQVKHAVVIAREDLPGEKHLVGYVVPRNPASAPDFESLRTHVRSSLPDYMLPSAFVLLEQLPLNANGKLDRRALPKPESYAHSRPRYEAPQGDQEIALAQIWQELLRVERVGRHESFFELGGHSLLAVKTLFRINQAFGSSLNVTDLYREPTLQGLATRIREGATIDEFVDLTAEAWLEPDVPQVRGTLSLSPDNVMLTGGTGFVGRFLLYQLLQDTDATVWCVVRASSPQQAMFRLRETLLKWDLWRDEFQHRVIAVPGDLRQPRLGIDNGTYQLLCESIGSIYHCGVSMNHLETYAMAKPANVEAVRELVRFAGETKPKSINCVSTVSVFSSAGTAADRIVTESSAIDHEKHPGSSGYTASKWVAEKIFMTAQERGIACNIFRLGLVWADATQGRYDELQREYRLFKSCLMSGFGIENYGYSTAPVPVDFVARSIVGLAKRHVRGGGVFHLASAEHPMRNVFARCNQIMGTSLRLLPMFDWIAEIKRLHHAGQSLPVVPLVEYAFAMDEKSFYERRLQSQAASARIASDRTHLELKQIGIDAAALNDEMLRVFISRMLSNDT